MSYIDLIKAFEKWLETNYLPSSAQLLWYKLMSLFNKAGWCEWITVDNRRLMSIMQMESEKTLIKCRDRLIDNNFFEYQKGKKGCPNKYKILTVNFTVQTTVKKGVQMTVQTTANVSNIKDKDKDVYYYLLYKYKARVEEANPRERILIIGECRKEEGYNDLSVELQEKLFYELMSIGHQ